jgi:hypothetical protein
MWYKLCQNKIFVNLVSLQILILIVRKKIIRNKFCVQNVYAAQKFKYK